MNCNHCGSAVAVLNNIDDEQFCSEEHRTAYLCADDYTRPKTMRGILPAGPRIGGQQIEIADPTHSADFQFGNFFLAGSVTPPQGSCAAEDFALEIVAPASAIREAQLSLCCATELPELRMLWRASAAGTNFPYVLSLPAAHLPRMPEPIPAALLSNEASRQSFLNGRTGQSDRPKWHRWAVLAACFVGIAGGTEFLVSRRSDLAAEAASRRPVAAFEDFSAGFSLWDGVEAGPRSWALESGKEAIPNSLALFKPSSGMTDYRLEFSGDVKRNGISWAVRAADHLNYQALEITERKKASEFQLWFTRYKVVAGKEGPRTQVLLHILLPAQSLWLVRMETVGESSTLWIENQIANSWADAGAAPGGSIGFFAAKGDQYILKKVRITPQ